MREFSLNSSRIRGIKPGLSLPARRNCRYRARTCFCSLLCRDMTGRRPQHPERRRIWSELRSSRRHNITRTRFRLQLQTPNHPQSFLIHHQSVAAVAINWLWMQHWQRTLNTPLVFIFGSRCFWTFRMQRRPESKNQRVQMTKRRSFKDMMRESWLSHFFRLFSQAVKLSCNSLKFFFLPENL